LAASDSGGSKGETRAADEAGSVAAQAAPGGDSQGADILNAPAEEIARPNLPRHPCSDPARASDRDLCGVNGPQPSPTKFVSPIY